MHNLLEIGGNIPLAEEQLSLKNSEMDLYKFSEYKRNDYVFSGRTAFSLVLENICTRKNVLLPDYTCDQRYSLNDMDYLVTVMNKQMHCSG